MGEIALHMTASDSALAWLWLALHIATACVALIHVVLYKRDPRSAAYWVALILLVPFVGTFLYLLFGINVIRRRGRSYRHGLEKFSNGLAGADACLNGSNGGSGGHRGTGQVPSLMAVLDRISRFEFIAGNRIEVMRNGDESMGPMLEAIQSARFSVSLATYIFEAQGIGGDFVRALSDAVRRGVDVRVIVDDAGTRYSWPAVSKLLRERGVRVYHFMPMTKLLRLATLNLRNHRKLLVVDGRIGFTGGLNIREGNMLSRLPAHPIRDLHFRVEGPVVRQMQSVFAEDWCFCAGETMEGEGWFPELFAAGGIRAIGIPDGPDEDIEVMPSAFFAALSSAEKEVKILNPYFLPLPALMWSLKLCIQRGVKVTIVTPARNNIPPVAWAARTLFPELLLAGCRIFLSPEPFDHSKIFLVDGVWSFVGSTNWDPRSLRLNFEFNLACFDRELASRLDAEFQSKLAESREVTLADLEADSPGVRLRNGIARLFIPLL